MWAVKFIWNMAPQRGGGVVVTSQRWRREGLVVSWYAGGKISIQLHFDIYCCFIAQQKACVCVCVCVCARACVCVCVCVCKCVPSFAIRKSSWSFSFGATTNPTPFFALRCPKIAPFGGTWLVCGKSPTAGPFCGSFLLVVVDVCGWWYI